MKGTSQNRRRTIGNWVRGVGGGVDRETGALIGGSACWKLGYGAVHAVERLETKKNTQNTKQNKTKGAGKRPAAPSARKTKRKTRR